MWRSLGIRAARCTRPLASVSSVCTKPETVEDFEAFYRFPHVVTARFVQRAKLYQSVITLTYTPVALWMQNGTYVTVSVLAAAFTAGMLYVVGGFLDRVIGAIYLDRRRGDTLRVAHLTFWGNRADTDLPLADLLPPGPLDDLGFTKLRFLGHEGSFKLNLRFGGILDRDVFDRVFGGSLKAAGRR